MIHDTSKKVPKKEIILFWKAVENGATHYTHWFQPLTGITAEKHDSFVSHPDAEGKMSASIERSSGVFLSSASPV